MSPDSFARKFEVDRRDKTSIIVAIALIVLGAALAALLLCSIADAAARLPRGHLGPTHAVLPVNDKDWREGPPGMPAGARFAVISGDPTQPGAFMLRAELPAGYAIAPYRRSSDENVVVLAGSLKLGAGSVFEESEMRRLESGSFVVLPANQAHFAATDDGATVQIFGTGPFAMEYVRQTRSSPAH